MADMPFDKQTHLRPKSNGKTPEARIASDESGPVVFDRITFFERLMGDEGLAKMVILVFLEDIPQQMAGLKALIDRGPGPQD